MVEPVNKDPNPNFGSNAPFIFLSEFQNILSNYNDLFPYFDEPSTGQGTRPPNSSTAR